MLTSKQERIKAVNKLAYEIYMDRNEGYLMFSEIARYRKMNEKEVLRLYKIAKEVMKLGEDFWMHGLSSRAQRALKSCGYDSLEQVRNDLLDHRFDIEDLRGVGHKVAFEIRAWVLKPR